MGVGTQDHQGSQRAGAAGRMMRRPLASQLGAPCVRHGPHVGRTRFGCTSPLLPSRATDRFCRSQAIQVDLGFWSTLAGGWSRCRSAAACRFGRETQWRVNLGLDGIESRPAGMAKFRMVPHGIGCYMTLRAVGALTARNHGSAGDGPSTVLSVSAFRSFFSKTFYGYYPHYMVAYHICPGAAHLWSTEQADGPIPSG